MTLIEKRWAEAYPSSVFFPACENNVGEMLTPVVVGGTINKTVFLISERFQTIMFAPRLMFHFIGSDHIHIDDIIVKQYNHGNGTIAIQALCEFARQNGVKRITGNLSEVDNDHADRRDHFYRKNGFSVHKDYVEKVL